MTREDIEALFKTEEYGKAIVAIKNELKKEPDDGEFIYLLFLAENGDYSNIDLNNIVNEVNFNRALDYSNRRLRNEFEAEYNFYRDSDPLFRKLFCYASRENKKKFLELFNKIDGATLPKEIDDYIDNLDYVIASKTSNISYELNIMALNLLYIFTKEEKLIKEIKFLVKRISPNIKKYDKYMIKNTKKDLIDFLKFDNDKGNVTNDEVERGINYYNDKKYGFALTIFKSNINLLRAKYYYGLCLVNGQGIDANVDSGIKYIFDAANEKLPEAMVKIGVFYLRGYSLKQDTEKAYSYFIEATKYNYPDAYYYVGLTYENNENFDEAYKWYRMGEKLISPACIFKLAYFFSNGINVKQDYNEALRLYKIIEDYPSSANNIGLFYLNGKGVKQNLSKAREYFLIADKGGCKNAKSNLELVESLLR